MGLAKSLLAFPVPPVPSDLGRSYRAFFPADQRMVHRLYPDSKLFSAGSRQSRTVGTESSSNASIWIPAPACFSQNQMEFLQDPTFGNLCASPYRNVADLLQTQLGYR